jgi:hypothetical protein
MPPNAIAGDYTEALVILPEGGRHRARPDTALKLTSGLPSAARTRSRASLTDPPVGEPGQAPPCGLNSTASPARQMCRWFAHPLRHAPALELA